MSERDAKRRLMEGIGEVDDTYYQEAEYTEKELEKVKAYHNGSAGAAEPVRAKADEPLTDAEVKTEANLQIEVIGSEVRLQKKRKTMPIVPIVMGVTLAAAAILLFVFLWKPDRSDVVSTTESREGEEMTTSAESDETPVVTSVKIDEAHFPGEEFRKFVSENYDTDHDGTLSAKEISVVTMMEVTGNYNDITGIEYFSALIALDCSSNGLKELDVSNNRELVTLVCSNNKLTRLDVSHNTKLIGLGCAENELVVLDVSRNTLLTILECDQNYLVDLDVSNNSKLTTLHCSRNQLDHLNISNNAALTELYCHTNALTELDLSNAVALKMLQCEENQLTRLDVRKDVALEILYCSVNRLTELDLSGNAALTELICDYNELSQLDVSSNTKLEALRCSSNAITQLKVTSPVLYNLNCSYNSLTELDVSHLPALRTLTCGHNPMTEVDVSNNPELGNVFSGKGMTINGAREDCWIEESPF